MNPNCPSGSVWAVYVPLAIFPVDHDHRAKKSAAEGLSDNLHCPTVQKITTTDTSSGTSKEVKPSPKDEKAFSFTYFPIEDMPKRKPPKGARLKLCDSPGWGSKDGMWNLQSEWQSVRHSYINPICYWQIVVRFVWISKVTFRTKLVKDHFWSYTELQLCTRTCAYKVMSHCIRYTRRTQTLKSV